MNCAFCDYNPLIYAPFDQNSQSVKMQHSLKISKTDFPFSGYSSHRQFLVLSLNWICLFYFFTSNGIIFY